MARSSGLREWIALPTIANMGINHREGAEYMRKLVLDAGFQQAKIIHDRRRSGRFRDARCRRQGHAGDLFHVRRQALRPGRMVIAAARRADRRPARRGQGDDRPRRGQPEGAGDGFPDGAAGLQSRRRQASGQPGVCRGRRGGNRLAPFLPDRQSARGSRRAGKGGRNIHSVARPSRSTGRRRCCWAPRARSNCSSSPAAQNGAAGRTRTFTPA